MGKGITLLSNLIISKSIFTESNAVFLVGIILNSFLFFYAPILYLFALSIVKGSISIKKHIAHFIPFAIFFVLNVALVFMFLLKRDSEVTSNILWIRNSFDKLYFVQVIAYTLISFWVVYKYKSDDLRFVRISKWLKLTLVLFLTIWLMFLISSLINTSPKISNAFTFLGILLLLGLSNITLFQLLNHPEFFYNNLTVKLRKETANPKINKEIYTKLCNLVEEKKLYKNADLKINDLSEALGESARNISILINTFYKGNFYDFINFYRIEEAKLLLKNGNDDMTILTILYESGFNSKSVFNAVFKKMEGQTPSAYRKNHITSLYG
ncbi:helix-turn-helix domain-containing protein [Tenacibaculum crassostreae]|uniref:helix-turn-helix domain-containing protein n=1 Tax=Tenacibaculum crassostreae TaxID=502683 RepID=UPI0038958A45